MSFLLKNIIRRMAPVDNYVRAFDPNMPQYVLVVTKVAKLKDEHICEAHGPYEDMLQAREAKQRIFKNIGLPEWSINNSATIKVDIVKLGQPIIQRQ